MDFFFNKILKNYEHLRAIKFICILNSIETVEKTCDLGKKKQILLFVLTRFSLIKKLSEIIRLCFVMHYKSFFGLHVLYFKNCLIKFRGV